MSRSSSMPKFEIIDGEIYLAGHPIKSEFLKEFDVSHHNNTVEF